MRNKGWKFAIAAVAVVVLFWAGLATAARPKDSTSLDGDVQKLTASGLERGQAQAILRELVAIGPRLSGSPNAERAVQWGKKKMEALGFENVRLEPAMVTHWVHAKGDALVVKGKGIGAQPLAVTALGGSVGTPKGGITAEVVEVDSWDELTALGDTAKGKIIFFNRAMDPSKENPFDAYEGAVDQRVKGATAAAKVGAVAALVRSVTTKLDDHPHTGLVFYKEEGVPKVPAAAVSTKAADRLSRLLKKDPQLTAHLAMDCEMREPIESSNVIGELRGAKHPDEVVLIGAHLDSWDNGPGAHDDGAGIAHVLEAARLIKAQGLAPERTIRVVLFMDEEYGGVGGKGYAATKRPGEKHIAAIESDEGGFAPNGFRVDAKPRVLKRLQEFGPLLKPVGADDIQKGFGGVDIKRLKDQGVPLIGLSITPTHYFDYHHSAADTFAAVDAADLEKGAIAISVLSFALAEEGL